MMRRARSQQDFHPLVAFGQIISTLDFIPVLHEALTRKIVSPTRRQRPIATDFPRQKIHVMNPGSRPTRPG
jgi:hypothetical protein